MIREATDNDREAIIQLIDEIFQEYGDRVFLEGAESDLMAISDEFYGKGGQFWVYEIDHQIVGTAAVVPDNAGKAVLKRVYLHKNYRGSGIADELLQKLRIGAAKTISARSVFGRTPGLSAPTIFTKSAVSNAAEFAG